MLENVSFISDVASVAWNPRNRKRLSGLGYDFTGYGTLVEVSTHHLAHGSHAIVRIQCPDCGKQRDVPFKRVVFLGHSRCRSCALFDDLSDQKFGRWTVLEVGPRKGTAYTWRCRCECGTTRYVWGPDLRRGGSLSCGCRRDEYIGTLQYRVGPAHPLWNPNITKDERLRIRGWDYKDLQIAVLERDLYTCDVCGQHGGDLEAHHLDGWATSIEERKTAENMVTMCKDCHRNFHKWNGGASHPCIHDDYHAWKAIGAIP